MRFKSIVLTTILATTTFAAHSLEFMGKNINEMNATQLHQFLTSKGAKRESTNGLVSVYNLKGSQVPLAFAARTFVDEQEKFVGLQILFPYDPQSHINLRKSLAEKYKIGSNFSGKHFFGIKEWKISNATSIEYNADSFKQVNKNGERTSFERSNMFMFYRNDVRRNNLLKSIEQQQYNAEKDQLIQAF